MKNQVQEVVKAIFGDEKTRAEFMADPGSVLSRFNLTVQEKSALLHTGLVTSDSPQMEAAIVARDEWGAPMP